VKRKKNGHNLDLQLIALFLNREIQIKIKENQIALKFANDVAAKVRFREAHEDVKRELMGHLEDNFTAATSYGLSPDDALADSIKRMGNPAEIGDSLDKVHQPKIETPTVLAVTVLCLSGLIALKASGWITLQIVWMILGLALSVVVFRLPYKQLKNSLAALYPVAVLGLLVAQVSNVSFAGQPYVSIFGLNIKIIDLASILMAISMSALFEKIGKTKWGPPALSLAILIPLFYFVVIGSALPAILLLGGSLVAIGMSNSRSWVTFFVGASGSLLTLLFTKSPFLSVEQMQVSAKNESHTDFVVSALSSNSIFFGAIAIVAFVFFLTQIARRSHEIKNTWLKSTAMTCVAIFAIEIIFGLTSNFGFAPMFNTGINIPFLSYGGSLIVAHLCMVGVTLACLKRKSIQHFYFAENQD
jgi:rod shape determining protein RodA